MGFPTVGIPGTIDNDLAYTDYTLGFDTAVNTACECVNRIRETSESHERASLITVMGRDCGEIALHTAVDCGAEFALLPEVEWSVEEIADRIKWGVLNGKRSTILIEAEGANKSLTSDLHALCETHQELADIKDDKRTSSKLARVLEVLSGHEVRATVLGYTQRGGTPSAMDRRLGSQFGARAVELLNENKGGRAVGIKDQKIVDVPFEEVHGTKRGVDEELSAASAGARPLLIAFQACFPGTPGSRESAVFFVRTAVFSFAATTRRTARLPGDRAEKICYNQANNDRWWRAYEVDRGSGRGD